MERVAIIPVACPKVIECNDFEERLTAEFVARTNLKIKTAAVVRTVMTNARIDKLDNETGHILAESLAVDAFLVVKIQEAVIDVAESKPAKIGMPFGGGPRNVKHVKLSLQLLTKDGATLLAAIGEAHVTGTFSGLNGVAMHTIEVVLQKAVADR
jgi:hypothetical protein